MPIRKLPPLLVNQIAAGEVIERPASVVKELLENAVDAGATRVAVDIEEGGATLIRVRDDGHGIPEDELPLALSAHATSKLQTAEQLGHIETLGFRGEALASIASVSRLKLLSLATVDGRRAASGARVEQEGDRVTGPEPAALAPGTVIEVRDLFFNTPARRRFMRTASTEFGHIADTVNRAAMTHPHLGFTLTHNGRKTLDLPPDQTRRQRCVGLLGNELEDALMETEHTDPPQQGGAGVWALVGQPSIARATSKFQYLCVNGRPVKDRNLAHAVKEAFRGLIPPDRQPVAVVHLTLDPHAVDVNVHPTKAEVRFREPQRVHGLVLSTIRRCLLAHDLTPEARFRPSEVTLQPAAPQEPTLDFAASAAPTAVAPPVENTPSAFVDYFKRMDPKQKGFVYEEVQREMGVPPEDGPNPSPTQGDGPDHTPPAALNTKPILQVHNSYVVTQDEQGVLIVDQHALHERMMFEELRSRILEQGRPLESQRLLMPATVPADTARQARLSELKPFLSQLGIEAEPMGPRTAAVHAFPSLLFDRGVEPTVFLTELLDKAEGGAFDAVLRGGADAGALEAALQEVLDMMSCKAAIKAGDKLTDVELAELLARREQLERKSNCPHGRPTTLRLTLRDLERQFGRS